MRILKTGIDKLDENIIDEAIDVLADGGIVLYPTDTVYGLGANIFNKEAVKRIFEIKHRDILKPLSVLVSDVRAISLVSRISEGQKEIIDNYLPGPYTFLLMKNKIVPRVVTGGSRYVGVRVPNNQIACNLARLFPITTTSANISDKEVLDNPQEILKQLNCDIDLVIDAGPLKSRRSSAIIDLTDGEPKIVRR